VAIVIEMLDMADQETMNPQERDNLMMASTVTQRILVNCGDTRQALLLGVWWVFRVFSLSSLHQPEYAILRKFISKVVLSAFTD
jgi:hypothetical protein